MDFIIELNAAISSGLQGFKHYVQKKMEQQEDFLEHFFWAPDASQRTVLNYLIHSYVESSDPDEVLCKERRAMMEYVLTVTKNRNAGAPLHQAMSEGKMQLALYLLELNLGMPKADACVFDVNQRDQDGRTLLSLAITGQWTEFLEALLKKKPNVHVPTSMSPSRVPFQPIHQAVILNYVPGIRLLCQHGSQLNNPCGSAQDTPVLLAAHLCKIDALEALLEQPVQKLMLDAERSVSPKEGSQAGNQNAIERLCQHMREGKNKTEALRGVAMLLCRGAEPPRSEAMRLLLSENRAALLKAIHAYLEDKPTLVDGFVNRCHLTESALHNIVYARHSWGNAIRHLFGKPSDTAFIIENLVVRKYTAHSEGTPATLPTSIADNISLETDPLKLYALFVKRYTEAYDNQLVTNSWSKMRWMIAEGECDWAKVQRYVATNPRSRSAIVYNEMFKPMPKIHDGIEDGVELGAATAAL